MSQFEKLVEKIRARPSEADFDDVCKLLEAFGWILDWERGSHCHFVKKGDLPFSIPKQSGRKVKRAYLEVICDRLGLDD